MSGNMIEFVEDAYLKQVPQDLVHKVEKAAQFMDFIGNYEVVIPKKAGMQINPWNRYISQGINPLTQNYLIIINPEWFNTLSEDQQNFMLVRSFELFEQGFTPRIIKYIPYVFFLLSLVLLVVLYLLLGKTGLGNQTVLRVLAAITLNWLIGYAVLNKIQERVVYYSASNHDFQINEAVVQKIGQRKAGIEALELYDAGIKKEFNEGETFWAPYLGLFEKFAQSLASMD